MTSSFGSGSNSSTINRGLTNATNSLSKSFEKLASGKRINRAADDAAGLAIAEALKAEAAVLEVGKRNTQDAQSLTQIAEGALGQIQSSLTRIGELATQAANGTLSDAQRASLQQEAAALGEEVSRIAASTEFNGVNVFSGNSTQIQVGTSTENGQIAVPSPSIENIISTITSGNIGTQAGAQSLLDQITPQINQIGSVLGQIGAASARLEVASNVNGVRSENVRSAESRIRDVNVAEEAANNTRLRILQETGTALNAQANLNSRTVLRLLS